MHLVIGGRGLIGSAVVNELANRGLTYISTTRSLPLRPNELFLDLLDFKNFPWPADKVHAVYLIAAINGGVECESNPITWPVNVDAQIDLATYYQNSFIVYVSTGAIESAGGMAYARQKAAVEGFIRTIKGGIVRAYKVGERAPEIAKTIVDIGVGKIAGVRRWM